MSVPTATIDFTTARLDSRALKSTILTWLSLAAAATALLPLASIVLLLLKYGAGHLSWKLFTTSGVQNGIGHALLGTFVMVGLASALAVPLGILAAIYLSEFGRGTRSSSVIRFAARVLSGIPSILAGVFAYSLVVLAMKGASAIAGGLALSLLMIPTVVLAAEQGLQGVSQRLRDAALAMGATPSQMVLRVVVPTAWPGMLTGVLLAVARAAGETAPLLFTALSSNYWMIESQGWWRRPAEWYGSLKQPTASLSVLIYNSATQADDLQKELAWSAALVLVVGVLVVNVASRVWSARKTY